MHGTCAVAAALLALFVAGASAQQVAEPRRPASAASQVVSRSTPHLRFTAAISPTVIVPGARLSLALDVVPKKGMHVYAPGTNYRPISIHLQTDSLLRVHDPVYPKPTLYLFKPLNEEVLVYEAPFRLLVSITAGDIDALRARLRGGSQTTIMGTLDYQACDDRVCYLPASVPFEWTMRITLRN